MYDPNELTAARTDFAAAFFVAGAVQIQRTTLEDDGGGGQISVTSIAATYDGRVVDAKRDRRRLEGETQVSVVRLQVQLPWNAVVRPTDQLIVNGLTFDVVGSDAGRSEALCLTVDVSSAS